ncbi:hypothetical protein PSPO01_05447 [Paraphaeosphaeria sporulosa]
MHTNSFWAGLSLSVLASAAPVRNCWSPAANLNPSAESGNRQCRAPQHGGHMTAAYPTPTPSLVSMAAEAQGLHNNGSKCFQEFVRRRAG